MSVGLYQEPLADRSAWLLALAAVPAGALILVSVGTAQWLVLRRHVARGVRWIPANALAWLLGLGVVLAGTSPVDENDPAPLAAAIGILAGLAMGATVAAVTGLALVRILRPRGRPRGLASRLGNPIVRALLRSPLHGLLDGSLLLLSYTGRRSGRRRTLPVMYARDDGRLLVVAGRPEGKRWWRNFRDPLPVDVFAEGRERHLVGVLVDDRYERERDLEIYLRRFPRAASSLAGDPENAVIVAIEPASPPR